MIDIDKDYILKLIEAKSTDNIRLTKLLDYYTGQQDILFRMLSDPTKPNNKIVANYCSLIADFFNSYLLGVPIKYSSQNEGFLNEILNIFNYNDEPEHNVTVGENMNIFGLGAEILYIDEDKQIRFKSLDPRETIFIHAKDIEADLETCIRFFPITPNTYTVEIYNKEMVSTYTMNSTFSELEMVSELPHSFGGVPLVSYANNQILQGSFEGIVELQDALNKLLSDELNDFEQFVDAYLVLTGLQGTEKEDISRMRENKVILLDNESNAQWLVKDVNNTHIKELKEDVTGRIYTIAKMPNTEDFKSLESGVAIKYRMLPTETQATKQERYFKKGIQRRIELIANVLKLTSPAIGDYREINIAFERNFIINDEVERQKMLIDVNSGLATKIEYRMRFYNETFDQAKEAIRKIDEERQDNNDGFEY